MTKKEIEERNIRMYGYFLSGYKPIEIAEMEGVSVDTVNRISSKYKWKEKRNKVQKNVAFEVANNTFVDNAVEVVNELYAENHKLLEKYREMMSDPESISSNGHISPYKLKTAIECLKMISEQLEKYTGFVPVDKLHEMQMKDTLTKIREVLSGYNDSDLIEDNFLTALNVVANRNFGDSITSNDVTELNNENERED